MRDVLAELSLIGSKAKTPNLADVIWRAALLLDGKLEVAGGAGDSFLAATIRTMRPFRVRSLYAFCRINPTTLYYMQLFLDMCLGNSSSIASCSKHTTRTLKKLGCPAPNSSNSLPIVNPMLRMR